MKHTPAPWITAYGTDLTTDEAAFAVVHLGKVEQAVCLISPVSKLTDEDKANARLICAAPELLQAARELLKAVEQKQFFQDGYSKGSASISEVMEASSNEHQAYSKLWELCKPL